VLYLVEFKQNPTSKSKLVRTKQWFATVSKCSMSAILPNKANKKQNKYNNAELVRAVVNAV